jgi:hypothetical protein
MAGQEPDDRLRELQRWTKATEKEIEDTAATIAPLEHRLLAAREKLDLLHRLTRLAETTEQHLVSGVSSLQQSEPGDASNASRVGRPDLEGNLEQILKEAGSPMHISDIRKALVDRAVPLPGRGDEANIIVRLRRAPERFVRTGRGMYALTALGLPPVPPGKRRRRVRVRRNA